MGILDDLFAKKPLKKAAEDPDANKTAPKTQDNTYMKKQVDSYMAKKKAAEKATKKLSPAPENAPLLPPAAKDALEEE